MVVLSHLCILSVWQLFAVYFNFVTWLQITRSLRLLNGFGWFLVQNEGVVLLVLFLNFTVLCLQVKWAKTLVAVGKVDFCEANSRTVDVLHTPVGYRPSRIHARIISRNMDIGKPIFSNTPEVSTHQIWTQSEHFGNIHVQKTFSTSKPRNQITYPCFLIPRYKGG